MNTRLLMMLHVKVATPQNIGAVPHGTRRTAPLSGGTSRARVFAERSCQAGAQTGCSSERTASSRWTFASRSGPTTARSSR